MSPLPPLFDALSVQRAAFLDALRGVDAPERVRSPAPTAWTPLQIAEHLVLVEEQIAMGLQRQLAAGPQRKDVGEPVDAKVEAVVTALRTPAQMAIPDGARGIVPSGEPDLGALEARWAAAYDELRRIAAALPPELLGVALLRHPTAGPIRFDQALRFLEAHIEHHTHQLARTVGALAPPSDAGAPEVPGG